MNARAMPVKPRVWNRQVLMGASAAALGWAVSTAALALPANPTIFANSPFVGTAATFTPGTGTLTVTQNADRVVIDWDSFNIASGETVTFVQGADNFIAFNRIDPGQFTTIDGNLFGNGSVWLFSPGGILFGTNAQVNVGSFFAGLGTLDDFQANESVGLTDLSVFVNFGNAENLNTLTVNPGAQIVSNGSGFVVLQASHLEIAGGEIGGAQSQVGFIVAEGGTVDFRQGVANPNGWELAAAHQASDPSGRGQPILHHYADTTADWIVIESAQFTESNFESVINLDGSMTVTGADPSNGDGIHVWGGTDTTADIINGEITNITASGQFTSVGDVSLGATEVYVTGDVVTSGDFEAFAYSILQVNGDTSIYAGGDVTLHSHGDIADIRINGIVHADAIVDIWSTSADTLTTIRGNVSAGGQVRIRSGGDVVVRYSASITGDTDGDGPANGVGVAITSGAALATPANTYYVSSGDLVVESGATISGGAGPDGQQAIVIANAGTVSFAGSMDGSKLVIRAGDDIEISGDLTAQEDVIVLGWTLAQPLVGGEVRLTGDASLVADGRLLVISRYGDLLIESGAYLRSDADDVDTAPIGNPPGPDLLVVSSRDKLEIEAGATLDAGANLAYLYADGIDTGSTLADAAMIISGDVSGGEVLAYAYNGSIVINGAIQSDSQIGIGSEGAVVVTEFATLDAVGDLSADWPYINGDAGVFIAAVDIAIAGEITANSIALRNVGGTADMIIGGDDGVANVGAYELDGQFNLSDDEFQHLHAATIVIVSGGDTADPDPVADVDMVVQDLTIDASVVNTIVLGASTLDTITIAGDLTPSQPGVVDLFIGGFRHNDELPNYNGFFPGQVNITGSIGTIANPFGLVSILSTGDILMGSLDFINAAESDANFDAVQDGHNLSVTADQIFIAADTLTMNANGRIIQQNTAPEGEYGGLLIGEPTQGAELISNDPDLADGLVIGGPNTYTVNFASGPTKVQLFAVFSGQTGPIEGRDVAETPWLLSSAIEDNVQYTINGCQFGGFSCGGTSEAPQFETPTDMAMADIPPADEAPSDDASADPASDEDPASDDEEAAEDQAASEDQDSELFRSLIAPGADRAYEQQRIGEPITGSGNEDLWTGHGDGVRP